MAGKSMSNTNLRIFTRAYSEELRENVENGSSIISYLNEEFKPSTTGILESTVELPDEAPSLGSNDSDDVDNAIKLYEYLENIDMTQASDKRLWTYLSHITFRNYTLARWPLKYSDVDIRSGGIALSKAQTYVLEHWFISGSARSLRRHSISRLWWAAHLTVAPWEKDPKYYRLEDTKDRFMFTRVLFSTQDIAQGILERKLGWSDKITFALLEYFRQNPSNRQVARNLIKEVNLVLGYRKLTILSFEELVGVINKLATTLDD